MRHGLTSLWVLTLISRVTSIQTLLEILSPSSLTRPNGYEHQSSEFGFTKCPFSYATQNCVLTANVIQVANSLCHDGINLSSYTESLVILAPRGDCSFVMQARRAQDLGASALFLADHTCRCDDVRQGLCVGSTNPCVDEPPILANDGFANDISIPTILLQKQDADAIANVVQYAPIITVRLQWQVTPNKANAVTMDYWHLPSPNSNDVPSFLEQILNQLVMEAAIVQFTPKYYLLDGATIGCHPDSNVVTDPTICAARCTNNGRYCASEDGGASGAHRIEEALRRLCIWEFYVEEEDTIGSNHYWDYVTNFTEACTDEFLWQDDTCSEQAMEQAEIRNMRISRCVIQPNDSPNTYLESNLRERQQQTVIGLDPPSLVINSIQYEAQTFAQTLGAICASYSWESLPGSCATCIYCVEPEQFTNCVVSGEICQSRQQEEIVVVPAPVPAPTLAPVPFFQPTEGTIQTTLTAQEETTSESAQPTIPTVPTTLQPSLRPTTTALEDAITQDGPIVVDNPISLAPTSGTDRDGELPLADPTETTKPQQEGSSDANNDDDSDGGLSDNTKVVIVVAVVGGAIVVIFAFVIFLVFKLLKRIRKLEKKEKQTPTTTSPAGSNIWDLPTYVGTKEDPFNSECEPIPPEVFEQIMEREPPVRNTTTTGSNDGIDAHETNAQNSSFTSIPATEPNRGVLVTEPERNNSLPQQSDHENAISTGTPDAKRTSSPVVASDREGQSFKPMVVTAEKPRPNEKSEMVCDNKPKAKPRRPAKQDPTWVDIMGKAAPEAKIPKSFSYEDEEKEEIVHESTSTEWGELDLSWDA